MEDDILGILAEEVNNKYGKKVTCGKDCKALSDKIENKTGRMISPTTLKRFFHIVQSPFKPSRYTLESLVVFLGFEDWDAYLNSFEESEHTNASESTWGHLKKRFQLITENSLTSLKLKTGYNPETFVLRRSAREKFEAFEASAKTVTMFVAPDGYGKSSTLLQLVKNYFTDPRAPFKNDLVGLIDGNIFFKLYSLNPKVTLLNQFLDFRMTSSLSYYFGRNPEYLKGRIWIVIDDVDEIFSNKEAYHQLIENLMRIIMAYSEYDWGKVILTCRPENLDVFSSLIRSNPVLESCWFDAGLFNNDMAEAINIKPYDEAEIKNILEKLEFEHSLESLTIYNSEILKIIRYPNFLSIFAKEFSRNDKVSEIELLNRFVEKRIYSQPYRDEKTALIERFLELCDLGQDMNFVEKSALPQKGVDPGYQELVAGGVIYEYSCKEGGLFNYKIYVKFCQNMTFEFILINEWMRNRVLNIDFINEIRAYYQNNEQLRCRLMKMIARILLRYGDYETLIQMHSAIEKSFEGVVESYYEILLCLRSVASVLRESMRNDEECRKALIPRMARARIGQILYFEEAFDIDGLMVSSGEYLKYFRDDKSIKSNAFVSYMLFLQGFISNNREQCTAEYEKIQGMANKYKGLPLFCSFYFNIEILFRASFNNESIHTIIIDVLKQSEYFLDQDIQKAGSIPKFEFSVIFALNLCEQYKELILVSDFITEHYKLSGIEDSYLYRYFQLCHNRALHHTRKDVPLTVLQDVDTIQFPHNMKHFMKINVDLIKIDFFLAHGKKDEAVELIESVKHFSSLLKFDFFYEKADRLDHMINPETLTY